MSPPFSLAPNAPRERRPSGTRAPAPPSASAPPPALAPTPAPAPAEALPGGWEARLEISVARAGERTVFARVRSQGPLVAQRLFYPEKTIFRAGAPPLPAPAHLCPLFPPGGLVSGDSLATRLTLMEGAALLATTTGATRFYRARENGPPQRAESVLTLGRDSSLEWLPQETIVFSGARGVAESRIEMEEGAKLIFAEITVLGRPGAMEEFARGRFDSFLSVRAHGRLALRERTGAVGSLEETGGPRWAQSPVGLGGYPTSAFFLAGGGGAREREKLERLAGALQRARGKGARLFPEAWGVTARDGFLLLRAVGADAGAARALLYLAWKLARPALLGRAARPPRIWRT